MVFFLEAAGEAVFAGFDFLGGAFSLGAALEGFSAISRLYALAIFDFLLAALFLWMTPLLTALSSCFKTTTKASLAAVLFLASVAS